MFAVATFAPLVGVWVMIGLPAATRYWARRNGWPVTRTSFRVALVRQKGWAVATGLGLVLAMCFDVAFTSSRTFPDAQNNLAVGFGVAVLCTSACAATWAIRSDFDMAGRANRSPSVNESPHPQG